MLVYQRVIDRVVAIADHVLGVAPWSHKSPLACLGVFLFGNDIWICGGRARPRGPGGSMKYQFVYLNVVTIYIYIYVYIYIYNYVYSHVYSHIAIYIGGQSIWLQGGQTVVISCIQSVVLFRLSFGTTVRQQIIIQMSQNPWFSP